MCRQCDKCGNEGCMLGQRVREGVEGMTVLVGACEEV